MAEAGEGEGGDSWTEVEDTWTGDKLDKSSRT